MGGFLPDSLRGKHARTGVLRSKEKLDTKASKYTWENASVPGKPNLTVSIFCQWVNSALLPWEFGSPFFKEHQHGDQMEVDAQVGV